MIENPLLHKFSLEHMYFTRWSNFITCEYSKFGFRFMTVQCFSINQRKKSIAIHLDFCKVNWKTFALISGKVIRVDGCDGTKKSTHLETTPNLTSQLNLARGDMEGANSKNKKTLSKHYIIEAVMECNETEESRLSKSTFRTPTKFTYQI